jgi:hypothetical protein
MIKMMKARRVAVVDLYMLRMYCLMFFLVVGLSAVANTSLPTFETLIPD